jgi:hypothetical protein
MVDLGEIVKLWEVVQVFHRYTVFQKIALIIGSPITLYVAYLCTLGRPPLTVHELRFSLLQDRQVRPLLTGGEAFEVEFRLINATSPPEEVNNLFGQLWVDGTAFVTSTIPPARGQSGAARVEWDLQIPVFPKEGVFIPARIALRMPPPGGEVLVGAQFVSKETTRAEYLWKIVNEAGKPRTVVVKSPGQN